MMMMMVMIMMVMMIIIIIYSTGFLRILFKVPLVLEVKNIGFQTLFCDVFLQQSGPIFFCSDS